MMGKKKKKKTQKTQTDKAQGLQIGPVWPLAHSTYNYSVVIFIYLFSALTRLGKRERESTRETESSHNAALLVRQQARNWKSYSNG